MGTQSTPTTPGTDSQLDRIERKLDLLLEALADEGQDEPQTVEVVTLSGERLSLPRDDPDHL